MARIGSFDVSVFRGLMPRARRRFRLKGQGGVNGDGVLFDAWHAGTVTITTRTLVPTSQATVLLDQYAAMQEQFVTVLDQFRDIYKDVLVCDVVTQREDVIGDNTHAVAIWTLLPQTIPPDGST